MLYISEGGINTALTENELTELTQIALSKLGRRDKVLILPPDYSRIASKAGIMAKAAFDYYGDRVKDIMPAIGTHLPMSMDEITRMYPGLPHSLFREHNWRGDVKTLGRVPADFIEEVSGLKLGFDWPAEVNRMLVDGGHDLVLSIGQVVPHEVAGMANYNKNIFIGTGGSEAINKSHYLGAAFGMERIMGRSDNPVRRVLNYASAHFASALPIIYIQTVVAADENGALKVRGIFIGDDAECFEKAAELSRRVNITTLKNRVKRIVVFLPGNKFRSTWIGNKAIYRSRLAIEDGGELFVIAAGVNTFGEDREIDRLIRKYGYRSTEEIVEAVKSNDDLSSNLGTAAHLIHSASEGRFSINYAAGGLSDAEIEGVGYNSLDLKSAEKLFNPQKNTPGFNLDADGEEFYLIKNAAIGLWSAGELK